MLEVGSERVLRAERASRLSCMERMQQHPATSDNSSVDFVGHLGDGGEGECGLVQDHV